MTQNRRIALNTLATYGRSIFGVLCGIFSTRWVLEALGQVDFGLYAVVGGMAIFLSFLNIQLAGAISRYYAYSIGQAKVAVDADSGVKECRAWFTTAVLIHTVVPLVLVIIGWPIGIYAIKHGWVSVPMERLDACLWVWRFVCIFAFLGMLTVPFQAMYTAKQYIAELTIYSFVQTLARTAFIYYMVVTPRDWLVSYAFVMGFITVLPQLVICLRAHKIFTECRIIPSAFRELDRVRQVASYAIWTAIGGVGFVASHQCMGILLNNFFGARITGSFGIAQTVSGEAASLTGALQGAFQPAITTAYGAGDMEGLKAMAFRVCKAGTLLTLLFAIPMALEIDEVLRLWLKTPPPYASEMCLCTLAFIVIEKLSCGHLTAVNASGRIAKFQIVRGILRTLVIPLAVVAAHIGWGPVAATASLPLSVVAVDLGDVYMARTRVGMSVYYWMEKVVAPICVLTMVVLVVAVIPRFFFAPSLLRVLLTTGFAFLTMLPCAWFFVLSDVERIAVLSKVLKRYRRR